MRSVLEELSKELSDKDPIAAVEKINNTFDLDLLAIHRSIIHELVQISEHERHKYKRSCEVKAKEKATRKRRRKRRLRRS